MDEDPPVSQETLDERDWLPEEDEALQLDNDNDTQKSSIQRSVSGLILTGVSGGVIPSREKESVKAGVACAVGKVCTYTL